ncbi:ImmA/IrrE family metallo-endopeptidase [Halobacillus kuroshimensis]|uniref:ImmA/IrrE family metallo-endopeptidase n=1 Tax=Halobacillus kuroshimensis TaxID=302481 RepID=A0ABS3DU92_9BACI|nr:ImmA/IrrE family metallo-endopeptidase [Halobacillus kuroshimensis]MBN8234916.1 ImmA/IrrE family metallo-endopeptidase [Halobacillus kuroshimensis]
MAKTKRPYRQKSPEKVKEEINRLTEGMEESITNHFHSPEEMKEYLDFMGKFHRYSPRNTALIDSQFPGAEAVGSYAFWKDKGFSVNKGEKSLKVLVPNRLGQQFQDEEGEWKPLKYATKKEKQQVKDGQLDKRDGRLVYSTGSVFDVSQTTATQKDLPQIFPNKWIDGEVEDYNQIRQGMEAIADKNNIQIVEPYEELGAAKGVSYTGRGEVALNPRNSERQDTKTLLHELTHAKLHTKENINDYTKPEKEFQAEMTAYTVASYFNIDTSDYSLDYLHHWTKDHEFKDHEKLLQEVQSTAKEFITTIEESMGQEKEGEKNMSVNEQKLEMEEEKQEREILPSEKLREMYRSQVSKAEKDRGPFGKEEKSEEDYSHQDFKDAYKKELMNFIEPAVGKELDKEENNDRQERLNQMRAFQENHTKEEVYQLKKESLQELKEMPLTDRGEQRLSQIESKLDREFHEEKESTPSKLKNGKGNKEASHQKEKQKEKVEIER